MAKDITSLSISVESKGIKEASTQLSGLSTTANNVEKRLSKLIETSSKLMNIQATATSTAKAYMDAMQGSGVGISGVTGRTESLASATTQLSKAMVLLSESMKNVETQSKRSSSALASHSGVMQEAHAVARGLSGSLGALWLTYGNIGGMLAGVALGASLKEAVVGFAKVEYQMTFVKALAEDTTHSVHQLTASMHDVASALGIAPEAAAKGLRALTQAGLSTTDALETLPVAFKLATVGELALEQAALAATGVMNAYGMKVRDLEHIGDVMAKAGAMSAASVDSISVSMKYAAGTAEQYGVSLEKLGTMLTLLGKRGITGSSAGVAANNLIAELYSPSSEKAIAAHAALGVKAYVGGVRQEIDTVMQSVKEGLVKYDPESQGMLLEAMFGKKGGKAFYAMAQGTKAEFLNLAAELANSTGFVADVYRANLQTLEGQFNLTTSSIKNMFAKIGEESSQPLRDMMTEIRRAADSEAVRDAFVGLAQSVKFFVTSILPVAAIAGGAFLALKVGTGVVAGLTTAWKAYLALDVAATLAKITSAGVLANPVFLAVVGTITLLAGAYFLLKKRKEDVHSLHAKEMTNAKETLDAGEKEITMLEKKLSLRQKGVREADLESAMRVADAGDNVQRIQDSITQKELFITSPAGRNLMNRQAAKDDLVKLRRDFDEAKSIQAQYISQAERQKSVRARLAEENKKQDAADLAANPPPAAGTVHYQPKAEKKTAEERAAAALAKKELSAFDALLKNAKDKLLIEEGQADSTHKLTDAEKELLRVREQLDKNALHASPAQQAELAKTEAKLSKIVEYNYAMRTYAVQQQEAYTASNKTIEAAEKEADALEAKARAVRLNKAETAEMELARLEANLQQLYSIGLCTRETAELEALISAKRRSSVAQQEIERSKHHRSGEEGALEALKKYGEAANDTGSMIENALTNAFKGAEDALVAFVKTGKLDFKSFADSIITDLIRIQLRKAMGFGSGSEGGIGSIVSAAVGGLAGGYGSFAMSNAGVAASQGLSIADLAGAFADGGDPPVGRPSLVGERGPEIFVPKQAGTIVPNEMIGGGGTSVTYSPQINIDSRTDRAEVVQLVQKANRQASAELVEKLQRTGRI